MKTVHRPVAGLRLVIVLLVPVVLLVGCGSDAGSDPTGTGGQPGDGTTEPGQAATATEEESGDGAAEPGAASGPLTVYSGRNEELVGPLFDSFTEATGIELRVRYGDTAELAATILEEGDNSPADVYFAQDAGALGALRSAGRLAPLPDGLLDMVESRFRASDSTWVGISGRARVLVYNTDSLAADEVPGSVLDLTEPEWRGRVGWAPTNGSFQALVSAMRVEMGDAATTEWVEGMLANGVRQYANNTAIVEATARDEIALGLVNHYYLYRFLTEDPSFPAANAFLDGGDVGTLVNVAGVGILTTSDHQAAATRLVEHLLSDDAQRFFSNETFEYPLVRGIPADDRLPPLDEIETPDLDLSDLEDLQGTLELLRRAGALT